METVAAVIAWTGPPGNVLDALTRCEEVKHVAVVTPDGITPPSTTATMLAATDLWSPAAIVDVLEWFQTTGADHLLWLASPAADIAPRGIGRLRTCLRDTQAALVFSDFHELGESAQLHPLVDYQPGSLRDDFDFGHVWLIDGGRLPALARELRGDADATRRGGWYELRLRLSEAGPVVHLPEPTYSVAVPETDGTGEAHFQYVDPRNREYQLEMERIATTHLRRINAYLAAPRCAPGRDRGIVSGRGERGDPRQEP